MKRRAVGKKNKISLLPLLLTMAAVISILVLQNYIMKNSQNKVYKTLSASAMQQMRLLSTMITEEQAFITYMADSAAHMEASSKQDVLSVFKKLTEHKKLYKQVWVVEKDGKAQSVDGEIQDFSDMNLFQNKESTFYDQRGIFIWDRIHGLAEDSILLVAIDSELIRRQLVSELYQEECYSFVCNSQGDIVINTEYEENRISSGHISAWMAGLEYLTGNQEQMKADLKSGRSGKISFLDTRGRREVKQFAVYQPAGINDWTIVVNVYGTVIDEAIYNTDNMEYILLAVLLGIFLAMLTYFSVTANSKNKKLRYEIVYDTLTGIYSRQTLWEKAKEILGHAKEGAYVFASIDIENFKVINDQFSHDEGDRLICYIADALKQVMDEVDGICARDTADVFLAFMFNSPENIDKMTEVLNRKVKNYDLSFTVRLRYGFYVADELSVPVRIMIDRAVLAQKTLGGNANVNTVYYDDNMRKKIIYEQKIVGIMEAALANGEFDLYYQPQYNQVTGEMVAAEALVRWIRPGGEIIPPNEFIPVFERNGFIVQLDDYVFDKACATIRKWRDSGITYVPISVNISRVDLEEPDFCDKICAAVKRHGIEPSEIRLEITESVYSKNPERLIRQVKEFRQLGFFVEMDDFGKGYSSLNMLKNIPVDLLKLDMSFLSETENDARSGIILSSVVRMVQWLNLEVIAEGVETKEQCDYLRTIGCHLIQGYYFARPMPLAEFEKSMALIKASSFDSTMDTTEFFDNKEIWNPHSLETLIFNSILGATGIFEDHSGMIDALRLNDMCFKELGMPRDQYGKLSKGLQELILPEDRPAMKETLKKAVETGEVVSFEARFLFPWEKQRNTWLHINYRVIAKGIEHYVLYASIRNNTEEKEKQIREKDQNLLIESLNQKLAVTQDDISFSEDFQTAIDNSGMYIYFVDPKTFKILHSNDVIKKYFGSEFVGHYCYKAFLNIESQCEKCSIKKYYENGGIPETTEIKRPDGAYILSQASPMRWKGQDVLMVTCIDVTKSKLAEEEARIRNEENVIVIKQSGKFVYKYDCRENRFNRYFDVRKLFKIDITGEAVDTPQKVVEKGLILPNEAHTYLAFYEAMRKGVPRGTMDLRIRLGTDEVNWHRWDYSLVYDKDNRPLHSIISISNIDKEIKNRLSLKKRAEADGLTGLYNRITTEEIINNILKNHEDEKNAMIIIDIDDFKGINDKFGHDAGDRVLKQIAKVLRDHFRDSDIAGRFGGDEFLIFLRNVTREKGLIKNLTVLSKKLKSINIGGEERISSGCSMGCVLAEDYDRTFDQLYKKADLALYHVKRNGKCGFALYSPEMSMKSIKR